MAPEIVKRKDYMGKPVDLWSMGVVLYALLCGRFPFSAKTYPELYKKIARGIFHIPDELSLAARDLIRNLLVVDPDTRYTLAQVKAHPWLSKVVISSSRVDRQSITATTASGFLISPNPQDDLDKDLMTRLEKFGVPRGATTSCVLQRKRNSITTTYYLLRNALQQLQQQKVEATPAHPASGAAFAPATAGGVTIFGAVAAADKARGLI